MIIVCCVKHTSRTVRLRGNISPKPQPRHRKKTSLTVHWHVQYSRLACQMTQKFTRTIAIRYRKVFGNFALKLSQSSVNQVYYVSAQCATRYSRDARALVLSNILRPAAAAVARL